MFAGEQHVEVEATWGIYQRMVTAYRRPDRAADVLAYFDQPGTSNGPTEAIDGRLEHLRGTALGVRNLANYITRARLDTGGFRPRIHPLLR